MLNNLYQKYLSSLKDTKKYRKLQHSKNILYNNQNYLDFSTNDYLLFSKNTKLLQAGIEAGKKYGVGATGSRLLSGNSEIFTQLENTIADKKNTESALFFSSGYLANFSVLSAITNKQILQSQPLVFFDRLNHASLYQAIFLSNPKLIRYIHNNLTSLEQLLQKYINNPSPKFIVAETVFGMDGDLLDLEKIIFLAKKYSTFLYLDEAHATGIFGNNGYGLSTLNNLKNIPHIIMGTFSKALGCCGAYIACSQILKEFLINKTSGFIYSTATSPIIAGIALKAWELLPDYSKQRKKLLDLAVYTRNELSKEGYNIGTSTSHIIPIILGSEETTLKTKYNLLKKKIIVSAIRPPTVPPNTSRIRIALNIGHTKEDINNLIKKLKNSIK